MKKKTAITPTREENYTEWYQEVIKASKLAEHAPVRGCMVMHPWGYAIWENIQKSLDAIFKASGVQNAYFPLFIPLSFLEKEAAHVEGFAKECAVVTHHRLEQNKNGKLVPAAPLEEPLVVRPTSEMIIGSMFAKWIESYRDLPLIINQWANVVRWEMRTRLFLRTTEFLWQEGHTAHATEKEAKDQAKLRLEQYTMFARDYLAMAVIPGEKSESERFPGADITYTIEALMQDGKALQAGTSHFLGQNFSKAQEIKFCDQSGQEQFVWTTSWGATTRLIGALVMTHADDDGLILPPKIAPLHLVVIPVIHKEETKAQVLKFCQDLAREIGGVSFSDSKIQVKVDERDMRGGDKTWGWIKQGVPLRLEIGPRDIENDAFVLKRRDIATKQEHSCTKQEILASISSTLQQMQDALLAQAEAMRDAHTKTVSTKEEFFAHFEQEKHPGFVFAHIHPDPALEQEIKEKLGVTIRCYPLDRKNEAGICLFSGKKSEKKAIFAKAY